MASESTVRSAAGFRRALPVLFAGSLVSLVLSPLSVNLDRLLWLGPALYYAFTTGYLLIWLVLLLKGRASRRDNLMAAILAVTFWTLEGIAWLTSR